MLTQVLLAVGAGVVLVAIGVVLGRHAGPRKTPASLQMVEAALSLSAAASPDDLAARMCALVERFLPTLGVAVVVTSPEGRTLDVRAATGVLAPIRAHQLTEQDCPALAEAIGRETLVPLGSAGDPDAPLLPDLPNVPGAIAPLHAHGETAGAVVWLAPAGHRATGEERHLLELASGEAALILANARLFDLFREGKEQWESVFDAIRDGIAVLDPEHRIERSNAALRALLPRSSSGGLGRHLCPEISSPPDPVHTLIHQAQQREERQTMTCRSTLLDRILRITVAPMTGRFAGEGWTATLIEDVTEWQALEARLIHNEQMIAVGQLVSGVAHELNNPLTSIAGLAEFLVSKSRRGARNTQHLRIIRDQAVRAQQIVMNLLEFARPGPAEVTEQNLSDIARRVTRLMTYELTLHNIMIETALAEDLPPIHGDRHQLQQVLVNLVTNAVHAASEQAERDHREAVVRVETGCDDDFVFVRVTDSGGGIPPDALGRIFTPFFTTKDPGQGTGLGLSISFGIAQGHGGSLRVESTGPEGTCLRLSLPAREPGRPGITSTPSAPTPSPSTRRLSGRVLLVERDPAVRRMLQVVFSTGTVSLDMAESASQAVRLLETDPRFDLIVADARATTRDGLSFPEVLLQSWPEHRVRTILLTADVRSETSAWLDRFGCLVLQKPFQLRRLLDAAESILASQPDDARAPDGP